MDEGRSPEALLYLDRGVAQLDRRHESSPSEQERDVRGRFEYVRARALASSAATQPGQIEAVLDSLERAHRLLPERVAVGLAQDPYFDAIRAQLPDFTH